MKLRKRLIAMLLVSAMLCICVPESFALQQKTPIAAADRQEAPTLGASSGKTGSCTWTLDGTVLTISGKGAMGNYGWVGQNYLTPPWDTGITEVIIQSGVTSIGEYSFSDCGKLTAVTIPDSVTSIGSCAFLECTSLKSITIPVGVTSIGSCAFEACSGLTTVEIPRGVISIGNAAFFECDNLTSITLPDTLTTIGSNAFYACGLTSIAIPAGVKSIGNLAFYQCSMLKAVYITDLDAWCRIAFENSYANPLSYGHNLYINNVLTTDITVGKNAGAIGDYAFTGSNLTSITISESVTSVSGNAFFKCNSLSSIVVESTNPVYHSEANCLIETATKTLTAGCKASIIPTNGNVTTIGAYAFSGLDLTSITIPGNISSVGDYAFSECGNLADVTFCQGTTTIGNQAFGYCCGLKNIILPTGVVSVGAEAFNNCYNLKSITVPMSVTSVGKNAFVQCYNLKKVYYGGTAASKAKITVASGNTDLTNAQWYYAGCASSGHLYHSDTDILCYACGEAREIKGLSGDMNGDETVNSDDAIYLLKAVFDSVNFPIAAGQNPDCNGDKSFNSDDAIYLLKHVFDKENFPLAK